MIFTTHAFSELTRFSTGGIAINMFKNEPLLHANFTAPICRCESRRPVFPDKMGTFTFPNPQYSDITNRYDINHEPK